MKKSIVAISASVLLSLSLSSCGLMFGNNNSDTTTEATVGSNTVIANTAPETITTEPVTTVATEPAVPGKIGDYIVTIENAVTCTGTDGNPIIIVTYNFTNNSDEIESLSSSSARIKLFQNGMELDDAFITRIPDEMNFDLGDFVRDIQPGYSISCQNAYQMNSNEGNVEIYLEDYSSGDSLRYEIEV